MIRELDKGSETMSSGIWDISLKTSKRKKILKRIKFKKSKNVLKKKTSKRKKILKRLKFEKSKNVLKKKTSKRKKILKRLKFEKSKNVLQETGLKYLVGIPWRNSIDLLHKAVQSIQVYWPHTIIIDNSQDRALSRDPFITSTVTVYTPPVPLTYTQSMNLFQQMALEQDCDIVIYMHSDAEANPGTPEALLAYVEWLRREGIKWGYALTNTDTLCAFNMEAVKIVGGWDTTLPMYFSDYDYYRRLQLAGYGFAESGLPVHHHNAVTVKSDPYLLHLTTVMQPLYRQYYETKWGGSPGGGEKFNIPFNLPEGIYRPEGL